MNRFLLAIGLVVALAVASPTVRAESGSEDCFVVRATSNARNQAGFYRPGTTQTSPIHRRSFEQPRWKIGRTDLNALYPQCL